MCFDKMNRHELTVSSAGLESTIGKRTAVTMSRLSTWNMEKEKEIEGEIKPNQTRGQ